MGYCGTGKHCWDCWKLSLNTTEGLCLQIGGSTESSTCSELPWYEIYDVNVSSHVLDFYWGDRFQAARAIDQMEVSNER